MHFTVSCPSCGSDFPVDPEKVPEEGVRAVCSTCQEIFPVERPPAVPTGGPDMGGPDEVPTELPEETPTEIPQEPPTVPAPEPPPTEPGPEPPTEPPEGPPMEPLSEAGEEREEMEEFDSYFEPVVGEDEDPEIQVEEAPAAEVGTGEMEEAASEGPVEEGVGLEEEVGDEPAVQAPRFGQRDPHDKARRLARVLVQDIIAYNREQYTRSVEQGTLRDDFQEEVRKSWEEYVEQVGGDLAGSTDYFQVALNDVLADGEEVFGGPPYGG